MKSSIIQITRHTAKHDKVKMLECNRLYPPLKLLYGQTTRCICHVSLLYRDKKEPGRRSSVTQLYTSQNRVDQMYLCQLSGRFRFSSISSLAHSCLAIHSSIATASAIAVPGVCSCGVGLRSCGVDAAGRSCCTVGGGQVAICGAGVSLIWSLLVELPEQSLFLLEELSALCVTGQYGLYDCGIVSCDLRKQREMNSQLGCCARNDGKGMQPSSKNFVSGTEHAAS